MKDSGRGIPKSKHQIIFKKFTQLSPGVDEGTGIGLNICKHVVELMGGNIWLESEVGHGTTFYFTILTQEAPSESKKDIVEVVPKLQRPLNNQNYPIKLLIVEDNLMNQRVLMKVIQRCGYEADIAQNGLEAISLLHQNHYDIVFMDVQMPVMVRILTSPYHNIRMGWRPHRKFSKRSSLRLSSWESLRVH